MKKSNDDIGKNKSTDSNNDEQLLSNPYDLYFRASMALPEIAIPFVKTHVAPQLASKINYSTLKVVKQSFITDELKEYASDVILEFDLIDPQPSTNKKPPNRKPTKNKTPPKIKVAILIEHQSKPDKFMAFRVFHYLLCYLQQQFKQQGSKKRLLTPVYPLIFYNGKQTPYPYSLKFENCFDDPYQLMTNVLASAIPLIDVNQLEENKLKTQQLLGIMTRALKIRNIVDSLNYLKSLMIDLNFVLFNENDVNNYGQIIMTYLANISEPEQLRKAIEENPKLTDSLKGEYMTAAEYFTQQGEAKGIAKGIASGEAKKSRAIAITALKKGLAIELVADLTELDIKIVEQINSELDKG